MRSISKVLLLTNNHNDFLCRGNRLRVITLLGASFEFVCGNEISIKNQKFYSVFIYVYILFVVFQRGALYLNVFPLAAPSDRAWPLPKA